MFPNLPYPGFSWQITQHAGCIDEALVIGLLRACLPFEDKQVSNEQIDLFIREHGIVDTAVDRSLWRDYQQIMYELGLICPTSLVDRHIRISPVGKELLCGHITFPEVLTLQLMLYQYPNGYKTVIPTDVKSYLDKTEQKFDSLAAFQAHCDVAIRPLVFIWRLIDALQMRDNRDAYLSSKEVQNIVLKCSQMDDLKNCLDVVVRGRGELVSAESPTSNIKRNGNDWITLLGRTMLFDVLPNHTITFSSISSENRDDIAWLFDYLSDITSFWYDEDPVTWFLETGSANHKVRELITNNRRDFYHVFPSVVVRHMMNNFKLILGGKNEQD